MRGKNPYRISVSDPRGMFRSRTLTLYARIRTLDDVVRDIERAMRPRYKLTSLKDARHRRRR